MLRRHNFGESGWLDSNAFLCEERVGNKTKCTLCETGWMEPSQVPHHKSGKKHFSKMWELLQANVEHKRRLCVVATVGNRHNREYFRNIPQKGFRTWVYESIIESYESSDALSHLVGKLDSHVTYEGIICIILKFTQLNRAGSAFFYSKCIMAFLGRGHNAAKTVSYKSK